MTFDQIKRRIAEGQIPKWYPLGYIRYRLSFEDDLTCLATLQDADFWIGWSNGKDFSSYSFSTVRRIAEEQWGLGSCEVVGSDLRNDPAAMICLVGDPTTSLSLLCSLASLLVDVCVRRGCYDYNDPDDEDSTPTPTPSYRALGELVEHPDPRVRMGLLRTLNRTYDEGIYNLVLCLQEDSDPEVRNEAQQCHMEFR